VSAGSSKQYVLTTPASSPASPVTVSAATTITGTYKAQYQVTFAQSGIGVDSTGTVVTVAGGPKTAADLPYSAYFDSGSSVSYSYSDPVASTVAGKRYALTTPTASPVSPVSVSGAATITGTYKVQFLLTITTNPSVVARTNVTPVDGWFDTGSSISLSATSPVTGGPGVGYVFKNWTGNAPAAPNASNPLSGVMDQARTIVANYTTLTLGWVAGVTFSAQYSDPTGLRAVLMSDGTALASKTINFSVGTNSESGVTNSSGVATDSTLLTQAPGSSYTATASCPAAQCGVALNITHAYTINQEEARATYTGALFASTASPTSTSAIVTLSATIQDISAVTGDPAWDSYPGDIRNATVTFFDRDAGKVIMADLPVGLVNASDTTTGTATYNWNVSITCPAPPCSQTYNIGVIVKNYYSRDSNVDNAIVNVAQPGNNFISGGGYLVMSSSAGLYPGQGATKNNWGFNVKYNKAGTNLQGNINTIIRNNGRVYQIKGNSMTSLSVQPAPCVNAPCGAVFNGKANIQDITGPVPIAIDGNATLQVTMTDNGEPGSTDTVAITVWNKAGGLWFSSKWDGTKTVEQLLGGGNLVVH